MCASIVVVGIASPEVIRTQGLWASRGSGSGPTSLKEEVDVSIAEEFAADYLSVTRERAVA